MYIYKTTNLINGKIYIGLSEKESSESINYLGSGDLIKKAISKYRSINFKKEILENQIKDKKELIRLEIKWIKYFKSNNRKIGYNISPGGDLNPGHIKKEIYQYSRSGDLIKKWDCIDDAVIFINSKSGDLYRKSTKESRPIKGSWWTPKEVAKDYIIEKDKKYTIERSKRFKEGSKKSYSNPEHKKRMQEKMREIRKKVKNFKKSDECKMKISEKLKGTKWYTNPLTGERKQSKNQIEGWILGRFQIPEYNIPR